MSIFPFQVQIKLINNYHQIIDNIIQIQPRRVQIVYKKAVVFQIQFIKLNFRKRQDKSIKRNKFIKKKENKKKIKKMSQNYEQWKLEQMQQIDYQKKRGKNVNSEGYSLRMDQNQNNGNNQQGNCNSQLDNCVDYQNKQGKTDYEMNWQYLKKDREPIGELQVVLNGNVVTILKQQIKSNGKRQNRKYSDQETYAMSNNILGPKFNDIPCPQFLNF
ncbi:unnamed protein product [Paramecium sonneborni]|uniref:Uncharacterized protein n=1 Tax=Paramecium sonneborni TaxID=65129 RepID=A0A8S1KBC8_9CILI|nr:unnamed protein product [Paramecium sonneborni]